MRTGENNTWKINILIIDNVSHVITMAINPLLPFIPDEGETLHLDPAKFLPAIDGYAEDECIAVKVWSREINVPQLIIKLRVIPEYNANIKLKK